MQSMSNCSACTRNRSWNCHKSSCSCQARETLKDFIIKSIHSKGMSHHNHSYYAFVLPMISFFTVFNQWLSLQLDQLTQIHHRLIILFTSSRCVWILCFERPHFCPHVFSLLVLWEWVRASGDQTPPCLALPARAGRGQLVLLNGVILSNFNLKFWRSIATLFSSLLCWNDFIFSSISHCQN